MMKNSFEPENPDEIMGQRILVAVLTTISAATIYHSGGNPSASELFNEYRNPLNYSENYSIPKNGFVQIIPNADEFRNFVSFLVSNNIPIENFIPGPDPFIIYIAMANSLETEPNADLLVGINVDRDRIVELSERINRAIVYFNLKGYEVGVKPIYTEIPITQTDDSISNFETINVAEIIKHLLENAESGVQGVELVVRNTQLNSTMTFQFITNPQYSNQVIGNLNNASNVEQSNGYYYVSDGNGNAIATAVPSQ